MVKNKELEAYDNIIQNMLVLYEEVKGNRPEEKEAIKSILRTLSSLRDCVCSPDEYLVSACAASGVSK